jgi:L-lactate dehydrogenase complex protein LldE
MLVDIFIPCFIDQIYPATGLNMVRVLEKAGADVYYNPNQTCCGQLAYKSGFREEAKKLGEKFLRDFPNDRPVVGPSASCAGYVRNHFANLFHNTGLHLEYKMLKKSIYEFSDFMVNVLKVEDVGAVFPHAVTIHDSCSALREYGLRDEPRRLLSHVQGIEIREMAEADVCCGFGGDFSVKFEPVSVDMVRRKVINAMETGAGYIVSTDSTCLMNMQSYIDKQQFRIKTIHLIDILASGW